MSADVLYLGGRGAGQARARPSARWLFTALVDAVALKR